MGECLAQAPDDSDGTYPPWAQILRHELNDAVEDHYIETAWYLSDGNAADAWRILHEVPVAVLTIWQGLRAYSNSYKPKGIN